MEKRVLIIEDDLDIANLIQINLKDIDCVSDLAMDGLSGLEYARSRAYDLIVLDIMLPKANGFEVCHRLRESNIHCPIIMLTSRSDEEDKVNCLNAGADDYITKPFGIRELLARVKANMRRASPEKVPSFLNAKDIFVFGDLKLDIKQHKLSYKNSPVEITSKEFDLLSLFMQNPGRTYTRNDLLNIIWGSSFTGYEHTVNSHINRLRMKIEENPSKPTYILTVWGVGYKFNDVLS